MTRAIADTVSDAAEKTGVKVEHLGLGENLLDAILGYVVVFIGLILLMCVVIIVGKIMVAKSKKPAEAPAAVKLEKTPAPTPAAVPKKLAPGSAGDVKIYDTDPRDAAMIMAIVADKLQKPLNELRFVSIKEVK